jgi:hypothetical protein
MRRRYLVEEVIRVDRRDVVRQNSTFDRRDLRLNDPLRRIVVAALDAITILVLQRVVQRETVDHGKHTAGRRYQHLSDSKETSAEAERTDVPL